MASTTSTIILVLLVFCILAALFFLVYYWFKIRQVSKSGNAKAKNNNQRQQQNQRSYKPPEVKSLYVPQEVGHRTGKQRLFNSSKGLRLYEVNEFGAPMPQKENHQV